MQLADRAELHRTFIADVERGKRNLSAKNLNKLARPFVFRLSVYSKALNPRPNTFSSLTTATTMFYC